MRLHVAAFILAAASLAAPPAHADMANGSYECWYFSEARLTFNFTVLGPDSYKGYDDTPGTYSHDTASGEVTFTSGTLSGAMPDGFKAIYEIREGVPTLSYISGRSGAEALFCQNTHG
ncbi:MAG: hypothetical protein AB7S92_19540 [Parvibaculaceae bacterium]